MIDVLIDPILPVFAILAFGFGMGRTGKTSQDDARVLNKFSLSVLLPIFLFGLIAHAPMHDFSLPPVLIYGAAELVVFAAAFALALGVFKCQPGEAVLLAFAGIFTNTALYILPISVILYGKDNILPITAQVTYDSVVTMAAAMIAVQAISQGKVSLSAILLRIAGTPMLQAVAAGTVVALLGLRIPAPIETFITFAGTAAAPVALFALGVAMSGTKFKLDAAVASFSAIKLVIFPIAVWGGLQLLVPSDPGRALYQLAAAGPSGAMAFSFALLYGVRTDRIAQVIVWTSVGSLITLAFLA
ncbi:hypothetical protein BV911_16545 [Pseudoruegeria sp. SK021]|nr:hypothetical protein BV911_16545 [Pseudoruegeria sp. SK021]